MEEETKAKKDYCHRSAKPECNDYLRRTGQCEPSLWAPESAAAVSPSARCTYDWSKLDAGWQWNLFDLLLKDTRCFSVHELETSSLPPLGCDSEYRELWHEAMAQLAKCRIEPMSPHIKAVGDDLLRTHERLHGPSEPKCIEGDIGTRAHYEELQRHWKHKLGHTARPIDSELQRKWDEAHGPKRPKLDLHQQLDQLSRERNDLRTERDKLQSKCSELEIALEFARSVVVECNRKCEEACCQRDQARNYRDDLRTKLHEVQAERDKLRSLLSDVAHAMAPLLRRIGEL